MVVVTRRAVHHMVATLTQLSAVLLLTIAALEAAWWSASGWRVPGYLQRLCLSLALCRKVRTGLRMDQTMVST